MRDTIILNKDFTTPLGDVLEAGSKFFVTEWYNLGGGCFIDNPNKEYEFHPVHHVVGIPSNYIAPKTEEELLVWKRNHYELIEKLRRFYDGEK